MSVALTHVGRTPGQTQFGLDTFTEHYKANVAADVIISGTSGPTSPDTQMGAVHPDYVFMFVTSRYCNETGPSSSALDVTYTGCIRDDGMGHPALPASKTRYNNPVQSATTFSPDGVSVTAQFYAIVTEYNWITYLGPGIAGAGPAPSGTPVIISYIVGESAYSPSNYPIASLFELTETDIVSSEEIVAGKFWLNTEQRTLYYGSFLNVCHQYSTTTRAVCLHAAGTGYSPGDTLTCTDLSSHTATMVVATVTGGGSITDFSVTSDAISATIYEVISAVGGTGSGATFRFYGA